MYNYQIQHTITEHTKKQFTCTYTCVFICYMPTCIQEISPGGGVQTQYFPGGSSSFRGGGGSLFYQETCGFSKEGGPDILPTLDLRTTYIHVSLYKAFKM